MGNVPKYYSIGRGVLPMGEVPMYLSILVLPVMGNVPKWANIVLGNGRGT